MNEIVNFNGVENKIISVRDIQVILDRDVAVLYDVQTKEINQALKNNPDKFPEGYVLEISKEEYNSLKSKFLTLEKSGKGQHPKYLPKAFTEKGLYMLATILKGTKATQTTIAIVEAFAKLRELSRTVAELAESPEEFKQKSLMQKGGEIIADILGEDLRITDTETSIELNFALLKVKHTIKQKRDK
ncbi:MAG: ORF6N domain-containing protein [Candidatus Symbiothrix sp.]|jgi:phage regulator Rha-like protein|nr:ORF6N domain-containing protein [Candidatus Symbiothrix sp.]